jgi:general secretion pathway protein D
VTNFTRHVFGASFLLTLIAGCAADRLHQEGLSAIDRGEYETGVADLNQAVVHDPHNIVYRLDLESRRESAIEALISEADLARGAGKLEAATALYRRALNIDPTNERARQGLQGLEGDKLHGQTMEAARKDFERKDYEAAEAKVRGILNEDPGYVPAQELTAAINVARGPITVAPRLQTRDNHKVTLQLRDAPTKMVFEVLQRETGINFILDKDVKSDSKTSIFVQDVPVEQAIDLVLDQSQLARQILADNMVMIYPNTQAKQKDYEQQIVKTFYLTNAVPKDVESMLKTVLGAKTLYVDERSNVIVMRDTPDAVRMAEKLVASVDVAEPEVMLELEVLEISRSRLQDLGIQYPASATFTPTPVSGGTGLVLSDLSHQSSSTIGISSLAVTVNAMKQTGLVNTLASPRIRARNKEKAKVLIGQREPVITNSVTPTAAGTPVVTGSVQYLDVGLTLEVQPTVYLDTDVAVKINLEVSSILKQVTTTSGTIAYEIGTRNANTMLRLKDGETQILAGLIQDSDTRNFNAIPGLGDIPLLGHLFGEQHLDREKSEIVLSITPRIIRMQPRPASDATEFWYGSESRMRTRPLGTEAGVGSRSSGSGQSGSNQGGGPRAAPTVYPPSGPVPAAGPQPISPSVAPASVSAPLSGPTGPTNNEAGAAFTSPTPQPSPQGLPVNAPPAPIVAADNAPVAADTAATGAGATTSAAGSAGAATAGSRAATASTATHSALSIDGPAGAKVGEEFDVQVRVSAQEPITRLRSQLRFDASALQLVSASPGDAVPAGAGSPTVNTRGAGAQLDITTSEDDPVQGTGTLMALRFKAVAPRQSTNIAAMLNVLTSGGAAAASSSAEPLKLAIQP